MRRVAIALFVVVLPLTVERTSHGEAINLARLPRWLEESETYEFHVGDLARVRGTSWKFITHCPQSKEFLREAEEGDNRATSFDFVSRMQRPGNRGRR